MERDKKKKIARFTLLITGIFILLMGVSYAFIELTLTGEKSQTIVAGTLSLELLEDNNNISITDALPMYDEVGMIQEPFTFRVVNNGTSSANYVLKLVDITTGDKLSTSDVKYGLTKDGEQSISYLSNLTDGIIDSGNISGNGTTINYTLRLWIRDNLTENSLISGKSLSYKLALEVSQEIVDEAGCEVLAETEPNAPILASGMIAVTYDTTKGWVKADSTTSNWYDYSNQMWANAVTVTEETRATYMDLAVGEPISMDDINTMWVWVPRYSYTIMQQYGRKQCSELGEITLDSPSECRKINYPTELRASALTVCQGLEQQMAGTSTVTSEATCLAFAQAAGLSASTFEDIIEYGISEGYLEDTRELLETYPNNYVSGTAILPGAIDIKFISTGEKDTGTGKCESCAENWVTPEGFTFGNEELSGFWVGKFETSTLETCTPANSVGTGCDLTSLTPQIKPNVTSWRGARVSTFFQASRAMQNSTNASKYGFDIAGTSSMDTHMLKNTEWGIVAMLSQSKYGKYGNSAYTGANKEVYQNKSEEYITGSSNGTPSQETANTQVTYDTPDTGYGASTTGTIYGIYDMSGGAYEYVMGNLNNISGESTTWNSGFCGTNGPTENCVEWPDVKYYDLYTTEDITVGYKIGDTTFEARSWYGDYSSFVYSSYPWFKRGSNWASGTGAGVFGASNGRGNSNTNFSFRLSLKP